MDTAAEHDGPIPYMARTHAYHGAQGCPSYSSAHRLSGYETLLV